MNNNHWRACGLDGLRHSCSGKKDRDCLRVIPIRSVQGMWLEDFDDNRCIGARRVNRFGHSDPYSNDRLADQNGISPDMLCRLKCSTSVGLPLSAVRIRDAVYQALHHHYALTRALWHAISHTGEARSIRWHREGFHRGNPI